MPLFRPESFRSLDGLYGDAQLVPSISWKIVGGFLFVSLAVAMTFLAVGTRSRFTTVSGKISANAGVLHVAPIRRGIVDRILVHEGQSVEAGAPLARIRITTPDSAKVDNADAAALLIAAPRAGAVTDVTALPGDAAMPGVPLLSIVPPDALEAALDVPPDAAGLIEPGQPIRISVDGFSDQPPRTIEVRLRAVSRAAVPVIGSDGRSHDVFVATAPLAPETIAGHGGARPLRPGVTISARIATGRRNLAGWLLDPILAVARP